MLGIDKPLSDQAWDFGKAAGNAAVGAVKGLWDIAPIPQALGGSGVIEGPVGAVTGLARAHADQYQKAKQAEREGRNWEMAGHSVAAALPGIGPWAASIGERAGTGDVAGAAGEMFGGALMGEAVPMAYRGAKAVRASQAAKVPGKIEGELLMAVPATKAAPYTPQDLRAAKPYVNAQHEVAPVTTVRAFKEALDSSIGDIESRVTGYLDAFPTARVDPGIRASVAQALKDHPRADFAMQGLKELDTLSPSGAKTLKELDAIRAQLNAENRAVLKRNNYDQATARNTDFGFAAREVAAQKIRDSIYDYLEARGVQDVRQLRRDEGSLIKVRNAAERQSFAGQRPVPGSRDPGLVRRTLANAIDKGATAAGAYFGGPAGAVVGSTVGQDLSALVRGGRKTRDELIARAFNREDAGRPTFPQVPPQPPVAGLLPPRVIEGEIVEPSAPRADYVNAERVRPPLELPAGLPPRPVRVTPPPADTSGPIPPTLPENISRGADELGLSAAVPSASERSFMLRWLSDDLKEIQFQPSARMRGTAAADEWTARSAGESASNYAGRVAGTPTQEMFHAAGIKGTRAEIAAQLDRAIQGKKVNPKIDALADAMREAWDGQGFDWDLVSDQTVAAAGLRRKDFRAPASMPVPGDMPGVFAQLFGDGPGVSAPARAASPPSVGQLVMVNGQQVRVLSVKPDGTFEAVPAPGAKR